jgi:hypothetical protein
MRDSNSSLQVTILNDRPQGGSADLTGPSTIELMQHRRLLTDDDYGLENYLNELDKDGAGIKVTARYYMQIFDMRKGSSLQREQQLQIQQPPQYFYSFNNERKE